MVMIPWWCVFYLKSCIWSLSWLTITHTHTHTHTYTHTHILTKSSLTPLQISFSFTACQACFDRITHQRRRVVTRSHPLREKIFSTVNLRMTTMTMEGEVEGAWLWLILMVPLIRKRWIIIWPVLHLPWLCSVLTLQCVLRLCYALIPFPHFLGLKSSVTPLHISITCTLPNTIPI